MEERRQSVLDHLMSAATPLPGLLPRMFCVRQRFPRPRVTDVASAVARELEVLLPTARPGAEIGITVGSRGIAGIAAIVKAAVDFLEKRGARPFIIPAMGSHGGAVAEGQRHLIGYFGITEESMGAPIRDRMETRSIGKTPEGVEVFLAATALDSDGVLLLNRVKPHTDYKGRIESGLTKICAIGLGKYEGAEECHGHLYDIGLGEAIRIAAERIVSSGKILGGLAILENAYHETARMEAVPVEGLFAREEGLLEEARGLMGRLPLQELDVLICERMGKNISGAGLDTNIIGRSVYGYFPGVPWQKGMAAIYRIVVLDLSDESDGNAVGMGMADFVSERFARKVRHPVTTINAVTACAPSQGRLPIVARNDAEALSMALRTSPRRPGGSLVALVRDTLDLEKVCLSEACLPLIREREDLEVLSGPDPLQFDADGNMVSPLR